MGGIQKLFRMWARSLSMRKQSLILGNFGGGSAGESVKGSVDCTHKASRYTMTDDFLRLREMQS